MKIASWNVNGIRACAKKDFFDYLEQGSPDILCLQETKANTENLPPELINPMGYHSIYHAAEKPGYSGVALFTKLKPKTVLEGFGIPRYDREGRVIIAEYDQFFVLGVYFPNGQRDELRLEYKLEFYKDLFDYCDKLKSEGKHIIICGDYNTAHTEIDLANPKENENYSGFLPIERAWLDKIIEMGYVDTFRHFNKEPNQYTWWTYRFQARKRNIGWRIDYIFTDDRLLPHIQNAYIEPQYKGSDHCPVAIELKLP